MKLDTVIKLYGRNVMEQLRLCHNENEVMQVVSNAGYSVTPNEAKEILALMTLLTGGLRELTLEELSQVTGGTA
ncbi:MAG: hypothetical protein PUD56_06300 [Prevotella sp.]|nr:hypothetical protein [Prevotella sp.]